MRSIMLFIVISLLFGTTSFASSQLEEQVQNHEERIIQLENRLADLQYLLETNQQSSSRSGQSTLDSMIGRWDCTDGSFRSEIQFQANGRLLQTDLVLGATKSNQWIRRSNDEIALVNGNSFKLEFPSQDQVIVEETNTRTRWECTRIEE